MRWFGKLFVIGVVVLLAWWIRQRFFLTDETRIKRQIAALAGAVENNNLLKLSDGIANDYSDDRGLDKQTLLVAARVFRNQNDSVFIHISDLTVRLNADAPTAQATLIVKILSKSKGTASQTELNAERVRLSFRKTDDGWKLTHAESPQLKFE